MKRHLLLLTVFCILGFTLLNAQTKKGNAFIGVSAKGASTLFGYSGTGPNLINLGLSTAKVKSDANNSEESYSYKTLNLSYSPKIGYFVVDNLALGLDINIAFSSLNYGGDYQINMTTLSAGPFLRYYIPTGKVLPYFEVGGTYGITNSKIKSDGNDQDGSKSGLMSFGGGIGISVPLGDRVAFDLMAGYNSLTSKNKENNENNARTIMGDLGLRIGFMILLGSN